MSIVCLDTQIIRWGVLKEPSKTDNAEELVAKASFFIDWLDTKHAEVILPAFIVGELLVTVPAREHARVLNQIKKDWMIVDFDLLAAQQFAVMRHDQALRQIMDDIRQNNPYATRRQLIADVMIIATAIAHGAEKIYSHNADFIRFATGFIPVENFLDVEFQTNFLDKVPPAEDAEPLD